MDKKALKYGIFASTNEYMNIQASYNCTDATVAPEAELFVGETDGYWSVAIDEFHGVVFTADGCRQARCPYYFRDDVHRLGRRQFCNRKKINETLRQCPTERKGLDVNYSQ